MTANTRLLTDYGDALMELEQLLGDERPLRDQLDAVAALLGAVLDAKRVVIYGNSESDDADVRVRASWSVDGEPEFEQWVAAIPLLTRPQRGEAVVTSAPRGDYCPSDCDESLPGCALRGGCATLMYPLRIAGVVYGRMAVHARTGRGWTDAQQSLVQQAAYRIGLQVARCHHARMHEDLAAERTGIATTVLHQLATPVTIILGLLDQIGVGEAATTASDRAAFVELARIECERLRRLCDDLTAIVTVTDGSAAVESCDLVHEVAACVTSARARSGDATFAITVAGEVGLVRCNSRLLRRVLHGLIDNAVRYTPAPAHVELTIWNEQGRAVVRLRDDGPGVSQADASRLAEPFSRLDPDMKINPGGAGLSLAIARQLVRGVTEDLRIEPRTDATGTQVTIMLPNATTLS